ncbi:MAG TPA: hypothetical protein VLE49_11880 [Anaerolineales bacterium]|nr:hypothetical protein [Anaerolineales bacterium]
MITGFSFEQVAGAAGVTVTIVRASNVGVKVGMVGRGVIVSVGGICVGLGVNVGGTIVGIAEGKGGVMLATVAGAQPVRIKIPLNRPIKNRFIAFRPTFFPLSSFLYRV